MDTSEGLHKPLGKFIFNNINFGKHDPLVPLLREANYRVVDNPIDPNAVLVTLPVKFDGIEFDMVDGVEVNLESAVTQLERYKRWQRNYTQQNSSVTISYSPEEVDDIINWLDNNWGDYVGVSFLYRTDPTKTAKDLGYLYLPQEVVTENEYYHYIDTLKPVNLDQGNSFDEIEDQGCGATACPIK